MPANRIPFLPFRVIILAAVFLLAGLSAAYSSTVFSNNNTNNLPVNFTAKTLTHDDQAQTVTAIGDVELTQGDRILRADKMVYYLQEDKVTAIGNVSLLDEDGNVSFAEYAELHNHMKDGFVQGLLALLADGSRFTAAEGVRENNGTKTTMTDATYTVCKVCEANPHPLWQIKASKVVHDATAQTVHYDNARLEFAGIPVLYSPIFSHPDPTLQQKSGFLRPQYGWSKELGTHATAGYYYGIAPDKDATLMVEPTTREGTLFEGEWRQRFEHGEVKIDGSTADSDRKEEDGRVETDRQRGDIFADGRFDLNEDWRTGFDIARASDKQYLRLYDISKENVLNNQVYAEQFENRDYSRIAAMNFQDVRLGVRPEQPDILPMAEHSMFGDPAALLGGRWDADFSALGLNRSNNNQKVQRGSVDAGWQRRMYSAAGLATTVDLDARGDMYSVQDSDVSKLDPTVDSNPDSLRGLVTASVISSYPLVRRINAAKAVIEPIAGIDISPKAHQNPDKIPNEDSLDVQLDSNNFFDRNRYPGIDRQEDGGRANYGLKAGLYGDDGRFVKTFLGQSYRFYGDKMFPNGSGFDDQTSDYIGQFTVGLSKYLSADYRVQLDDSTMAVRRHEVQAGGGNDTFQLNSRYLYLAPIVGTGFPQSRQQLELDGSYKLTPTWTFTASELADLGDQPGLRNATTGLTYADECFSFGVEGSRNVADDASGENETKILLRIGFKNIGEFSGPQIQLGSQQSKK